MADSSQKFISRNRAPRVQIEYDVELYGAEKKVQLPFVMGVMSDLAGKSEEPQPPVADRKFLEIDTDNFDARMKSMRPRAAFTVPNTLTGEGEVAVDLTFESMADFSPAEIARKVEPLRKLLEARTQLSNLMTYMDGKTGAETLIEQTLQDPALLSALATNAATQPDRSPPGLSAALDALRSAAPEDGEASDRTAAALDALRSATPEDGSAPDTTSAALDALRSVAPKEEDAPDTTTVALDALRSAAPEAEEAPDTTSAALAALRSAAPEAEEAPDTASATLAALRSATPEAEEAPDTTSAALAALRAAAPEDDGAPDTRSSALEALRSATPEEADAPDTTSAALDALRSATPENEETPDAAAAALEALRATTPMEAEDATDTAAAALDALRSATPEDERTPDTSAAALDALRAVAPHEDPLADLLADAAPLVDTDTGPEEALASVLSGSGAEFDPLADLLADELSPADEGEAGGDLPDPALPGEGAETAPDGLPDPAPAEDPLAALDAFLDPTPDAEIPAPATDDALAGPDDLLVGSAGGESVDPDAEDGADLDDLLATLGGEASAPDADAEEGAPEPDAEDGTDLDDLMAMLGGEASALGGEVAEIAPEPDAEDGTDLDDLLATLGGEASAPDADAEEGAPEPDAEDGTDLDDLLATLGGEASAPDADAEEGAPEPGAEDGTDLDDLLATFGGEASAPDAAAEEGAPAPVTEMEDSMALLDDLLAAPPQAAAARPAGPVIARITAPKPSAEALARPRFRMAVFGDFSGRAAAGKIETGDALARRRPIELDVDTVEEVIEGFATRLVLPVGPDGKGIEVPLGGLDDLHPDEIVGNCEIFEALKGLRQRLSVPSMAARAVAEMQGWAGEFTTQATATHRHSAASSVPTDRRLSDFQKLIGDVSGRLTQVSPVDDMIAQIIGPHVVPGPSPEAAVLKASVDAAMGSAMKLILHHPEFQAIEAQWRGLDLLARRIETDVKLQIILFDVSAEELAADLAASDDLAQTGLFRLLDAPLQEEGGIGFSALFGLYTFEETPPHAELLTRVAQVAAHVEAPFFAAITPGYLEVDLRDRHPLTARAWDGLRAHDAAGWLGLVTPRFLLRRPYGRKSDPIDAFEFEEFSEQEGLKGMLWANPVLLTALLMAAEWKAGGPKMTLGGQMSMGDMPYHFARDRHGDQVALPCTERNMTEALVRHTMTRGYMPVVSIRGRDVVRLASFQSLAGSEIAGPWSGAPPVRDKGPVASGLDLEMEMPAPDDGVETGETGDTAAAAEDDLDALLASFGDVDTPSDPNAIDAELAALLEGL